MIRCLGSCAVAAAVALVGIAPAAGETAKLVVKRLDPAVAGQEKDGQPLLENAILSETEAQSFEFSRKNGALVWKDAAKAPPFAEVIRKEPAYASRQPLRAVARLGSRHYGFVLDTADPPPEQRSTEPERGGPLARAGVAAARRAAHGKDPPEKQYLRLYFDRNHNGDLTDDAVVEAVAEDSPQVKTRFHSFSFNPWRPPREFPPITLDLDVDGVTFEYTLVMNVQSWDWRTDVTAELRAASWREGRITIQGKPQRVVLADHNSNGRFDDAPREVPPDEESADEQGTVEVAAGDVLFLLDPDVKWASPDLFQSFLMVDRGAVRRRHSVGRVIAVEDRFFDLAVSPAGDAVTLTPSRTAVGHVVNPNRGYRAMVIGPQGVLPIEGDAEGKAPLPAGQWKVIHYSLDPARAAAAGQRFAASRSLARAVGQVLFAPFLPDGDRQTFAMAEMPAAVGPVVVAEGQTVAIPFGPPYRPVVKVDDPIDEGGDVTLELQLVGTAGEICEYIVVNGERPGTPEVKITTPDGQVVNTGQFEYG